MFNEILYIYIYIYIYTIRYLLSLAEFVKDELWSSSKQSEYLSAFKNGERYVILRVYITVSTFIAGENA